MYIANVLGRNATNNNNSQLHEQFNPLSPNSDQDQFSPNNNPYTVNRELIK